MKKPKILRIIPVLVSTILVFSLIPASTTHAAPSNIFFSPGSGTYNTGTSFSVQVRATSDPVYFSGGSTSGTINFPISRLRVNSVSTSGSSYPGIGVSFNNSNGTITWNGNAYPSPTDIYLFTINFQALTAGTAAVTFSDDTTVNYNPSYGIWSTNKTNASYSLATPPPPPTPPPTPPPATCPAGQVGTPPNCTTPPPSTCPAGQTGTPPNCTTPPPTPSPGSGTPPPASPRPTTPTITDTSVPTPTAQPNPTPVQVDAGDLSIKDVVAKITRKVNSVEWKTTLGNITTEIALGTSKDKLTVKPSIAKQGENSYKAVMDNLKPGVRYYFTITATVANNPTKKASYSGAFTTRGYPVLLVVTKDGKKVANAVIEIERQSFKTDKDGGLELELTDSTFNAKITLPDETKKEVTFTVTKKTIPDNGSNPETQTFTFDLTTQPTAQNTGGSSSLILIIGSIGALAALLVGGVIYLLYRRRSAEENAGQVATVEPYTWEQGAAAVPVQNTYIQPEEQQLTNLASIEQQYIPETEPQPEVVYEAQPLAETPISAPLPPSPAPVPVEVENYPPQQTMPTEPTTYAYTSQPIAPEGEIPSSDMTTTEQAPQISHVTSALQQGPAAPAQTDEPVNQAADGEEAVYHPETGELDIIHGHEPDISPALEAPQTNSPVAASPVPAVTPPSNINVDTMPLPPAEATPDVNISQGRQVLS